MRLLERFRKSEYARHSTLLMAGTAVNMALQSASMLWLGNLYGPEYMGLNQYFSTAYSILLILATGRYELAIMLPADDQDGYLLTLLSAGLSSCFSVLLLLLLLGGRLLFGPALDWTLFLPPALAVLGVYYSCNYWLNRKKRYRQLAFNRVLQGVLFVAFNTGYAYLLPSRRYGLILGYLSAQAAVAAMLAVSMAKDYRRCEIHFDWKRLRELAGEHAKFPRISAPSALVNNLAVHLPVLLLGPLAGNAVVGQYSMMTRVLGAPITILSEAIRDVFRQRASSDYAANGECRHTYVTTLKTLALVALVPFGILMAAALPLFRFLFGDTYLMAAWFIVLMSPFYYVKFIVSPLTFMTYIVGKQAFDMKWQTAFCLASTAAFVTGYLFTRNPYWMMLCFGVSQTVLYGISLWYTRRFAKGEFVS